MALSKAMAKLAKDTGSDVFTPDGDAGAIDALHRDGTATLSGRLTEGTRWSLSDLEPSKELLSLASKETPPVI